MELLLAVVGRILAAIRNLVVGHIMAVVRMRVDRMAIVALAVNIHPSLAVSIHPSLAVTCHTRADPSFMVGPSFGVVPSFMVGPSFGVVPSSYLVVSTCLAATCHPS